MKSRNRILIFILILTMLLLAGCGIPSEGIDVTSQAPDGWWQTFFVWPLANSLVWLNTYLEGFGVPYHWGFAIILFTVIIKILTFPLTLTQIRGMKAQREIQPRVQELQKKYGKDREKLAAEQMKLYKEAGVNPLSGCLPLVVQMPILFGLYSALVALSGQIDKARFFWIPNLGFPSYNGGLSWIMNDFNCIMGDIPESGCVSALVDYSPLGHLAAYLVLPIVLVVSQYSVQKWMTPTPPTTGDNSQAAMTRQIGTMMTFMFGFFTLQVPAGLSLYWVTSNLLQVAQQLIIGRDTSGSGGIGGKYAAESLQSETAEIEADTGSPNGSSLDTKSVASSTNGSQKNNSAKNASNRTKSRRKKRKR